MNMDLLSSRAHAVEGAFFKAETDACLLERAAKLGVQARAGASGVMASPTNALATDMLPEVLRHHLPVDKQRKLVQLRSAKDYFVHTPTQGAAKVFHDLTRKTYVDQITLGSSMRTGRSKWTASALPQENTSIWNFRDAPRLMQEGGRCPSREVALRHVAPKKPVPVMMLGGVPYRLLPEPTPGRALFWGTVLCVWAGAATAKVALRTLGVEKVEDLRPKVTPVVNGMAQSVKQMTEPVKEWRANNHIGDAMDTQFSRKLKSVMA